MPGFTHKVMKTCNQINGNLNVNHLIKTITHENIKYEEMKFTIYLHRSILEFVYLALIKHFSFIFSIHC